MTLWNDCLLVDVENIDKQHKMLVKAIDDLMEACAKGQEKARVSETLDFVVSYTKVHFKDEEAIQEESDYPELAEHREMHQQFIKVVEGIVDDYKANGATEELIDTIGETLVGWLVHHISVEDKKIGIYLKDE